jgi:glutaconate CoA-transferase subunit A
MQVLSRGQGNLFSDPSTVRAREFFATRSRAHTDKVMSVAEAVRLLIHDGDYLALAGFGANRIPTAVLHEILRQGKQNLRIGGHTATHDFQLLAAGNGMGRGKTIAQVDIAYVVGLEARGLSPHARRVMESGEVQCTEWSNYAFALRFKAAAMGVPFLPAHTMLGTDTFRQSAACEITCPFTGERLVAVPALYPDVTAIHVHEADRFGNCRLRGTTVVDLEKARASKRVIITCERLIDEEEIRRDPSQTAIPFFCVDAVCEVPYGSYPGNMPYEYASDEEHLRGWLEAEEDTQQHRAWLDRHIYGVKDHFEYLQVCGGLARMQQLRQRELLLDRPR